MIFSLEKFSHTIAARAGNSLRTLSSYISAHIPCAADSLGKFSYYLVAFMVFYCIFSLYSFNVHDKSFTIQMVGNFTGSFICILFSLLMTLLNYVFRMGHCSDLTTEIIYLFAFCLLLGLPSLIVLSSFEFTFSQIHSISFYMESTTKTFLFISYCIFFYNLQSVGILFGLLRFIIIICAFYITHTMLKNLNHWIVAKAKLFKSDEFNTSDIKNKNEK